MLDTSLFPKCHVTLSFLFAEFVAYKQIIRPVSNFDTQRQLNMPAYWSHFVSQLSTQRARWISTPFNSSEHDRFDEQTDNKFVDVQPPASSNSESDSECDLKRENESLKREIRELNDHVSQLRQRLDARGEQIQVLVTGMRYLRLQQRRWSSLSSIDGASGLETGDDTRCHLMNLDSLSSGSSSDDEEGITNELSATFDGWIESDDEEKDEEPDLSMIMSPPLKNKHSMLVNQQRSPVRSQTQ